ncbi:SusC/RagA family TonB-linked outer membrane protein [Prevotella sp. P3-122]|uniref:SusC/RagA family TonB-linked outer membrane protein n=1 Tax=Prevotella sp. P3-122 TaxID=2024223 RepID=UPI000B967778|nr:SusC/RagA family TonB-linked outer membrane protein [Prevotella sp. P3-122]OYP60683.1 SusC/RagA family protein [Prevotella sp. P3-122]
MILLKKIPKCRFLFLALLLTIGATAFAQKVKITGTVTDPGGEPLIGVSVKTGNSGAGAITDVDGNYSVEVSPTGTLVFSYVGFEVRNEPVKNRRVINVTLKEKNDVLNEVVVIGYGTMDKKELTSAISHVGEKDFLTISSLDPSMMIQGKVAGVSITNTGAGDPNNQASIQIRGVSSRSAGLGPLIVIDGVPGGNLTNINPNDIASFDILKDGAASAIYGTRGSNGVIVVTTKKGSKDGRMHTSYSGMFSWDVINKELDMMSAQEFRDVRLGWGDTGVDLGGNVDWLDAVSRTGTAQQHTLTLSGGNDKSNYRVSADYRDAKGIDLRSHRREYGARASIMHTTKGGLFTITANIAPRIIYRDQADWGVFKDAIEANPTTPLMDPENPTRYYNFQGQVVGSNPVERQLLEKDHGDTKLLDWDGTVRLNLLPLLGNDSDGNHRLSTQVMFADHQYDNDNSWFRPSTSTICINNGREGEASRSYSKERQYVVEWLTNYSGSFGSHNVKGMAGYSYQYAQYSGLDAYNKDFPNDGLGYDNLGSGEYAKEEGEIDMGSYRNDSKLISFFGRVSYDYAGKYMFTASLRHEGSSKFGADNKWGNFPAVSAGWRISEEPFMKNVKWVSDLKLRADYGVTGNQDFGSYISLNTMTGFGYYFYNGKYFQVWGPSKNVNPDLRWEKGKNWNIGIDFSLFNNRVYGSVNYFNRKQQDLLGNYKVSVPPYLFDETFVNVGTMKNTGIEIDVNFKAVNTKDFSYDLNFVGTTMKNKFVDFSNSKYIGQDYYDMAGTEDPYPFYNLQRIQKGESLGNFYMWRYAGHSADGEWLVYDKDGDIIRASQASDADRQVVGNGMPKFTMSSSHNFRYKNFDLSLFFRGAFGYDIFNIHDFYYGTRNFTGNRLDKAYGKNFVVSGSANPVVCDYFLEKGDYLKLDMMTLGYTLNLKDCPYLDRVRVYGTMKNIFTITKFSGVDPSSYQVNGLYPGAQGSRTYFPTTRQFIVGLQIDF